MVAPVPVALVEVEVEVPGMCLYSKESASKHHDPPYYFYFIDEDYGLCYLRVPTWAPFRLQFYCNAHNWL